MNLTHEVVVIAADPPLAQRPRVPKQMRRRHALELESIEEGNEEEIDLPLRNYMIKKNSKKPKKK